VVQAVRKTLNISSLKIIVSVSPGLGNHGDSEDQKIIDVGDILGVADIENNLDVIGRNISDSSVSEDEWVVVRFPDLDGTVTVFGSEAGVDVVSVWVDREDVIGLKSCRPDDDQVVSLRPVPVGRLEVGKSSSLNSTKDLGHFEVVEIRLEGVMEWIVDEAVSSELKLTGVRLEHADWASCISNAHLLFSECSEEVIGFPVAVGFAIANAVDSSVSGRSVGGWNGVWISTADLVGFDLLRLAGEWTKGSKVGEESVSVEANVEVNAFGLGGDTWVDVLDTNDWLLVDLTGVGFAGGSAVNRSPESISIDDLAFETSGVDWMSWSPSLVVDVGGLGEVVSQAEVIEPLHVVSVGDFDDSTGKGQAVSFSVGPGVWSEHLDASLLVVLA